MKKIPFNLKLITTEDGSHSLYREDLRETYHSFHGARGESMHVFIEHGLDYIYQKTRKETIRIFEVGFGTGLNALLAAGFAEEKSVRVEFHTLEPFPVPENIYRQFNYGRSESEASLLQALHAAPWGQSVKCSGYFHLSKYQQKLEDFGHDALKDSVDVVFFDAFAPSRQQELWAPEQLKKCYDLLTSGGALTTYCAQGQFKRNLAAAGFKVETLKGAMGKKEMVRGVKD